MSDTQLTDRPSSARTRVRKFSVRIAAAVRERAIGTTRHAERQAREQAAKARKRSNDVRRAPSNLREKNKCRSDRSCRSRRRRRRRLRRLCRHFCCCRRIKRTHVAWARDDV